MCQWTRDGPEQEEQDDQGKRYQTEQEVNLLRQVEVALASGQTTSRACKEAAIVVQRISTGERSTAVYRWTKRSDH